MIVAFQGFIGREMLLDNLRTARNSGHGHMVAAFMPGIANQALADLGEAVHIRQVHVFEGCRVGGLALQQGVGCARLAQQVHRVQDFFFAAHTGGYQHGQPARCNIAQQFVVRQVCGGNLHARNTVIDERLHGRRIPGGAQNIQAMLLNMVEYLVHLLNTQREP